MTISDASPVQFWPVDEETFNEKEVCSIESFCFCQPWQCDDTIQIQFSASELSAYYLLIYDADGNFLAGEAFYEIATDLWQDDISLTNYCDKDIQLQIADSSKVGFLLAPSSWSASISGTPFTLKTSTYFKQAPVVGTTYAAVTPMAIPRGQAIPPIGVYISGTTWNTPAPGLTVTFALLTFDGGTVLSSTSVLVNGTSIPFYNSTITLPTMVDGTPPGTSPATILRVSAVYQGTSLADFTIQLTNIGALISDSNQSHLDGASYVIDSPAVAVSDCLNVKTTQDCTELITYSNSNDFDDIEYDDTSPNREFTLRVPAVFFEESFPDESESIELSTSEIVQLTSTVKAKKMLDTDFMPFYMHKKLQLVLAHDNVSIQDKNWIKMDGYTILQGNKRYPMRRATVLLTDKDFIKRNVL